MHQSGRLSELQQFASRTSERVLVARQAGLDEPVTVEAIARSSITDVAVLHRGGVSIATRTGAVELSPFAPDDVDTLARSVARTRRAPAQVPRKRSAPRRRRAVTELDVIATLLEAGVLTEAEHDTMCARLLARVVAG